MLINLIISEKFFRLPITYFIYLSILCFHLVIHLEIVTAEIDCTMTNERRNTTTYDVIFFYSMYKHLRKPCTVFCSFPLCTNM